MSGNIKNTVALLTLVSFITVGCKHYAAFPEIEGEGELVSDNQNVSYDVSVSSGPKSILPVSSKKQTETKKAEQTVKKSEKKVKKEVKTEKTKEKPEVISLAAEPSVEKTTKEEKKAVDEKKDLTKPNPEIQDIPENEVKFTVPDKTTPSVITDMDLTEMDSTDGTAKIIKPDVETKTILPVKKERKIVKNKPSEEPSVFYLAESVYFSNGGAAVDRKYYAKLRNIVKEAKAHNGKIVVQGFSSSRTKNTDIVTHKMANLKVSVARAENVAKILAQYGMPKSRIITEGLSDSRPVYQEVMPEGERLNRRAEIYISY